MASLQKKLIFKKYKVEQLIAKTNISTIYKGINKITKEQVAMKFEKIGGKCNFLESEVYILLLLKGIGIPNVISYGKVMNYKVLIEELLGKSIYSIWKRIDNNENILIDVCLIAIQCLDRLEYIHSKNIVHKDIKPANFIFGKKDPQLIYIIDFGMSRKYKSSRTGKHIKYQKVKKINGTMRYMSINACKGYEHSRRDDLESLGYMLIFLIKNTLPWINIENEKISSKSKLENMRSIKTLITSKELCKDLPNEFIQYTDYCRELDFEQKPDYNYLRNLFINVIINNEKLFGSNILVSKHFSSLNKNVSKKNKKDIIFLSQISPRITDINKGKNNTYRRMYSLLKSSVEKKRKELSNLAESERLNSDFKMISINLSKNVDDENGKNTKSENVINITDDMNNIKRINKNILDNINNKMQIFNQKNIKVKKTMLKNFFRGNPKSIKKIPINKMSLNKKIFLNFNNKPKLLNIPNQQNDIKSHIRKNNNNNFKLIKDNIKKLIIKNSMTNLAQKQNIKYNLKTYQYQNKRNLAKYANFNNKEITHFPNNKNQLKDTSCNNKININSKLINDIHYTSIIKSEREKENLKKGNYLCDISLPNNLKIEYKINNTNNFYFNRDLITNPNNYISINKSNDRIDQTKELYTARKDESQNYKNYI